MIGSRARNPINNVFSRSRTIIAEAIRNRHGRYTSIHRDFSRSHPNFSDPSRIYYNCRLNEIERCPPCCEKKKKFGPNASCRYAILCDILKSFSFFFQLKIHRRRENEKIFSEMIIPSSSLCVCSYNNDCSTKCIATAAFLNQCSYTMFTN